MFSTESTFGTATYAGVTYSIRSPNTLDYVVSADPIVFSPLAALRKATLPAVRQRETR